MRPLRSIGWVIWSWLGSDDGSLLLLCGGGTFGRMSSMTHKHPLKAKPKRCVWDATKLGYLLERYPNERAADIARALNLSERQVWAKAVSLGLKKSAAFLASTLSGRTGPGSTRGSAAWFSPGHRPHNKGVPVESVHPNSARTQFQVGSRPLNWAPIGSTRTNADGYLQRKMTDTGSPADDWRCVHHLNWEAQHGPVPPGMALVFKDGNRMNVAINNLELITRQELMRRNTIHRFPDALKDAIRVLGKVKRMLHADELKIDR